MVTANLLSIRPGASVRRPRRGPHGAARRAADAADLNRQRCTLVALDLESGRWAVTTERGERLRVKPQNLSTLFAETMGSP